jgi:integrase/recombinase XerC
MLLYVNGIRRGEIVKMDVGDVDIKRSRIRILGRARGTQYEWMTIPDYTSVALSDYLKACGKADRETPLFARYRTR